ncbi:MAG TPA: MFS transporter [Pseudogracilibacillus sp.]|nr:MFS transporter [Pseudogracilibacillus sp.]
MSLREQHQQQPIRGGLFLLIGILLISANLRAPLTSVGSLVPIIRDSLGVSNSVIGTITTVPLLAFAIVSPFAPKLAHRFGLERTIFVSMIILLIGTVLRYVTGVGTLFIGTALIGIAISFGNVLIPGMVKMSFPLRVGAITGLYAVIMNVFGALASGVSVPLANIESFGWQGALAVWGIVTVIALFIWAPQLKNPTKMPVAEDDQKKTNMWASFTAWQVTLFMGLQSLMYYTVLTWLPDILQASGYSESVAGWLLSLQLFALIPMTFIIPIIAGKMDNQKLLGALTGIVFTLGILGLMSSNFYIILISVILLGIACGTGFSLSMMFFTLRTKNVTEASDLSGMAQSFGYLLAALGPVLIGLLQDLFHSWTMPLILLLICGAIILIVGFLAGRKVVIEA